MAGANIIVELLMKNQDLMITGPKFSSIDRASFIAVATVLASRALTGSKKYIIKLKPIHSALKWDALGITSLKSLQKFSPPVKPGSTWKDWVVKLRDALKYIICEVVRETLVRLFERLAVRFFSPYIVRKLVGDLAASVTRLAAKGVSGFKFLFKAAKATFLGYAIWALASWLVQVGLAIFEYFVSEKGEQVKDHTWGQRAWILGKKLLGITVICIIAFLFGCICASIGAFVFGWIGTLVGALALPSFLTWIISPATGMMIGFAVGDFVGSWLISAGKALISFCLKKLGIST